MGDCKHSTLSEYPERIAAGKPQTLARDLESADTRCHSWSNHMRRLSPHIAAEPASTSGMETNILSFASHDRGSVCQGKSKRQWRYPHPAKRASKAAKR